MTQTLTYGTPTAIATILSTELNALANGAYSAASAAIDNRTTKHLYMGLELALASLTPGAANTGCSVYLIPSIDASTYPDGGGAVVPGPETYLCCFAALSTSAGAKLRGVTGLPIPPLLFKLVLLNGAGVALANTGSTLDYIMYSELAT
jgi:hypothetical protein